MIIFTPNTVISSSDVNGNLDELKVKTDYLSAPDSGWTAPTLTNSWVHYGAPFSTPGYRIDALGYVHLRGLLKSGTVNLAMFTLPAGYRPESQLIFSTICNNAVSRIDVTTAGVVIQSGGSSNAFQSLDDIIFKAYQ